MVGIAGGIARELRVTLALEPGARKGGWEW
jgi:hypothetical protein